MNEQKCRKQWLWVFIINIFYSTVCSLAAFCFHPVAQKLGALHYMNLIPLVGVFTFAYVMYRCIYKKPGTKVVTFVLILTVLSFFMNILLTLMGKIPTANYLPYYGAMQVISYVMGVCWFVVCWRIRKVNKKLRTLALTK